MGYSDFSQAFLNRDPIPGVMYLHDDFVRVVAGAHQGASGSLVAVLTLEPEPRFVLEVESGFDVEVSQSEIELANAQPVTLARMPIVGRSQSMLGASRTHCCGSMKQHLATCDAHGANASCGDQFVSYVPKFDEYGLLVHDGGSSVIGIAFCPWCGSKLPESLRDKWFEELELKGFKDPTSEAIPEEYTDERWYKA